MDKLIKSPKITRGKGIRSVKIESVQKDSISDRNAAYTKLFDHYLSEQQQNKILIRKLTKHDYFSDVLRNKKELQNMSMKLLAKVLLFLDSKDDDYLFVRDAKLEIINYLNNPTIKQNKKLVKKVSVIDDDNIIENKEVLDFFRYVKFMKILMDNYNKFNNVDHEDHEEKPWIKNQKPMIHGFMEEK